MRAFNHSEGKGYFFKCPEVSHPRREFFPGCSAVLAMNCPCSGTAGSAFSSLGAGAPATMSLANKFAGHCGGSTLKTSAL